ncbi:Peptidase C14 caspase catalytic subunit p20 [Neorhizobium galegae bv. orientalis]|nr:Peptidase C14 caspase catalytic subunit p20 [Neorhizobium galegae bv. orientalis]
MASKQMFLFNKHGKFFSPSHLFAAALVYIVLAQAASAAFDADPERRVALVLGNSAYQRLEVLPNATKDVEEVATTLRKAGFDVTIGLNVDRLGLEDKVRTFLRAAHNAEVGLVYYSGHGIQVGGQNYLVPTDATLETAYDVETQTMPLDLILNHLKQNSRIQLVFLDACRNNPFNTGQYWVGEKLQPVSGATRGLARIDGNLGSLIAFSTAPGEVALDGAGTLSPYTEYFVKYASQPTKEVREVLTDVRRDVIAATKGRQVPWENSSLVDSFYFLKSPAPPKVEPMQQVSVAAGALSPQLALLAPRDQAGSDLTATISQAPLSGQIMLDGQVLTKGASFNATLLSGLVYDAKKVKAGTVDVIGYSVADPYRQSAQGMVAVTVVEDASAKLAQQQKATEDKSAIAKTHLAGLSREVAAEIGVGSVTAGLPQAPAAATDLVLKVAGLPEKGVVTVSGRTLDIGHQIGADELPQLGYEPAIGSENGSFKLALTAGTDLPDVAVTFKTALDPCDAAAAAPLDLQGVTAGRLPNEIDPATAIPACEKAVAAYPAVARFVYQLGRAQLANRDTKTAVKTFEKAISAGHVRATETLASLYSVGALGKRDAARSTKIVSAGAEKGDPFALYAYGKALYHGQGVEADINRGLRLMLQAADLGHTFAMNELGYIFLNGIKIDADPARAIAFYRAGVKRNDIYSMNNLALVYRFGKGGVPTDLDQARTYFEKAAAGGQPYAPTNLGRMYRDGIGVAADRVQAIKWLEMGAERGDYWGAFDRAQLAKASGSTELVTAARYFALASAVNMPGTGDKDDQAAKNLAALPNAAKKDAEKLLSDQLTPQERKALPKAASINERLVQLAKAGWVKRNPRYDLF